MITTVDEYLGALFKINDGNNIPTLATLLPNSENIYNIDLNSRTIEAPEFISVVDDHVSETVYFIVDRYYDNMDLSTTGCLIQYINAKGEYRVYPVPFYDIETYQFDNKMLIPWCIEGEATKAAGNIVFSLRFFLVDDSGKYLLFNLNTLSASSKVKAGIKILEGYFPIEITKEDFALGKNHYYIKDGAAENGYIQAKTYDPDTTYYILTDDYDYKASRAEAFESRIRRLEKDYALYWMDV